MKFRTAIAAATVAIALSAPSTLFARDIKIGVILPYSGGSAQFGEQIVDAAREAAQRSDR